VVVLGEGLGLVPVVRLSAVEEEGREGDGKVPIRGDYWIAFDVGAFGWGLLAHAVEGGFVLFLLEGSRHSV